MYIAVVHDITDPEKFWDVSRTAVEQGGIPEGFTVAADKAMGLPA